ncbi:MAG TPA: O-antigen ligase family protein, partial [Steroidobacteraceae bacterium]|nr:O-antigen ligase family protein [Steroidobacteraceae bacterium]
KADKPSWSSTTPARLLIVFTVWMWIQNAWALAPPEHLEASILFTKYVVLYYLLYTLLDTPEEVGNILLVHVLGCAFLGWLVFVAPSAGRLEGVGGPGIDEANALGMFVATGAVCGAMLMLAEQKWRRWVCVLAMPFILNAIIQTQSRGSMLGLVTAALIVVYLRPKGYRVQFYAFAVIGLVLFGYLAQDVFWKRMETLRVAVDDSAQMDSSAESRVVLAKAQLRMAKDYPFGTGHRGTAVLSPRYLDAKWLSPTAGRDPHAQAARSSHSTMMSALVEQGIPGAIIFLGLLIWLLRMIRKLKRATEAKPPPDGRTLLYGSAAAANLMLVFVAGMFTDYIKAEVQIWMLAVLALIANVYVPQERPARQRQGAPLGIQATPPNLGA